MGLVRTESLYGQGGKHQEVVITQTASTDVYVSLGAENIAEMDAVTMLIKNTGNTNSVDVKVILYANRDTSTGIPFETTTGLLAITPGTVKDFIVAYPWSVLDVQIKSTVGSAPTSVRVDMVKRVA